MQADKEEHQQKWVFIYSLLRRKRSEVFIDDVTQSGKEKLMDGAGVHSCQPD